MFPEIRLLNWRNPSTSKPTIACLTSEEADSPKCRISGRRRPKFEPHSARYNSELRKQGNKSLITPVFTTSVPFVTQASTLSHRSLITESPLNGEYYGVTKQPESATLSYTVHPYPRPFPSSSPRSSFFPKSNVQPVLTPTLYSTVLSTALLNIRNVTELPKQYIDYPHKTVSVSKLSVHNNRSLDWILKLKNGLLTARGGISDNLIATTVSITTMSPTTSTHWANAVSYNWEWWNGSYGMHTTADKHATKPSPLFWPVTPSSPPQTPVSVVKHFTHHSSDTTTARGDKYRNHTVAVVTLPKQSAPKIVNDQNNDNKILKINDSSANTKSGSYTSDKNKEKSSKANNDSISNSNINVYNKEVNSKDSAVTTNFSSISSMLVTLLPREPPWFFNTSRVTPKTAHVKSYSSHGALVVVSDYSNVHNVKSPINPVLYDPRYFEDLWFDLITTPAPVFYNSKAESARRITTPDSRVSQNVNLIITTKSLKATPIAATLSSSAAATKASMLPMYIRTTTTTSITSNQRSLETTTPGDIRRPGTTKAPIRKHTITRTTKSIGISTTRRRIYSTALVHNVRPTTPMNQPSLTAIKGPEGNGDFPRTALISIASLSVIIIIAIVVFCVFRCRQSGPSPEQYPMVCNGKQARYTPIPTEMSPQIVHGELGSHYVAQPISSSFIQTRVNQLNGYQPIKGTEVPKLNGVDTVNKNDNSNSKKKDFKEWYV